MSQLGSPQRRSFLIASLGSCIAGLLPGCIETSEPRILLPAYFYDASLWNEAIAPRTPGHWVIANVDNGPGTQADPHFTELFNQTRQNGHALFGYVATGYGQISQQSVIDQVAAWQTLYGIENIFLDEAGSDASTLAYYQDLIHALRDSVSDRRIVLNPGVVPLEDYFQIDSLVDIVVFEDSWSNFQVQDFPNWLDKWWSNAHVIVIDAPIEALQIVHEYVENKRARGFFVTDTEYHEQLPSYWETERNL